MDVLGQLHTIWPVVAFVAGFLAGGINVIVGAGTLVSFPLLVLLGYPPLTATIANTIGIVPGSASGVVVYRRELLARRRTVTMLLPASVAGGILGATLLLSFPAGVFTTVVPWLVGIGTLLVVLGPTIRAAVARRREPGEAAPAARPLPAFASRAALGTGVVGAFVLGTYGGYFSAAQGILLIGLLGIVSRLDMQELNAIKNLSVFAVNVIAAVVFLLVSPGRIDWPLVACIALGAACGGTVGGRFARRLSATFLRGFVAVVGVATCVAMLLR